MIISEETYEKCCPSYKEAVDELEIKIAQINNSNVSSATKSVKLYDAVMDFSKSYLTPREYWNFLMQDKDVRVFINDVEEWKNGCRLIAKGALLHFCYNSEWTAIKYQIGGGVYHYFNAYDDTHLKLLDFQSDFYLQSGKRERVNNSRRFVFPHFCFYYPYLPSMRIFTNKETVRHDYGIFEN
uniref:Uncharacterized protein n=1 Tax=Panagrolaimus davidi TaxID=227884 RepID=A0A914Q9S3_9BILA